MNRTCLVLLALAGCSSSTPTVAEPLPPGPQEVVREFVDDGVHRFEREAITEESVESTTAGSGGRSARRLSADQFYSALYGATGQHWDDYESRAAALGRPDYLNKTEQDLEASIAFERFVTEAALTTCQDAIIVDEARVPSERLLIPHGGRLAADPNADSTTASLKHLLLRFHGHHIDEDDGPMLAPWRRILAAAGADARARWTAVCVGLVLHQDFLTY